MNEELKTLKDLLEETKTVDNMLFCDYLREVAEEWIDKIEAKIKEKEGQFGDFGIDLGMAYTETGGAIIEFIKHFFNLEDEK
jgi:hypothetical protein